MRLNFLRKFIAIFYLSVSIGKSCRFSATEIYTLTLANISKNTQKNKMENNPVELLKKGFFLILDYLLFHLTVIFLAILTSILTYCFDYGINKLTIKLIIEIVKKQSLILFFLSIFVLYPVVWILIFNFTMKINKNYRTPILTLFGIICGIVVTSKHINWNLFFDFRYGAFSLIIGFLITSVIYPNSKLSISKRIEEKTFANNV